MQMLDSRSGAGGGNAGGGSFDGYDQLPEAQGAGNSYQSSTAASPAGADFEDDIPF
jgi:single-stranded DNA-binding protein